MLYRYKNICTSPLIKAVYEKGIYYYNSMITIFCQYPIF